ncbi:hypothetical protein [Lacticaseibacillus sp. GG6-2]
MAFKDLRQTATQIKTDTPKPTVEGAVYCIVFGATAVAGLLSFGIYKLLTPERVIAKKAKATVDKHRESTD